MTVVIILTVQSQKSLQEICSLDAQRATETNAVPQLNVSYTLEKPNANATITERYEFVRQKIYDRGDALTCLNSSRICNTNSTICYCELLPIIASYFSTYYCIDRSLYLSSDRNVFGIHLDGTKRTLYIYGNVSSIHDITRKGDCLSPRWIRVNGQEATIGSQDRRVCSVLALLVALERLILPILNELTNDMTLVNALGMLV